MITGGSVMAARHILQLDQASGRENRRFWRSCA